MLSTLHDTCADSDDSVDAIRGINQYTELYSYVLAMSVYRTYYLRIININVA